MSYLLFRGIDFHQLIYQLTKGERLSEPENCPKNISALMKKCFIENPHHRPGFDEIRKEIEEFYNVMITLSSSKEKEHNITSSYFVPTHEVSNNHMQDQYNALIEKNEASKNPASDDSSTKCRESLKYASLDDIAVFGGMRQEK